MLDWWRGAAVQTSPPTTPTEYPIGSFVETERGYFYIVSDSKRHRIISLRCLNSWSPPRVAQTTEAAVGKYKVSAKLKFRNGSLIHNIADGKIYLIESGKRRHIVSPDASERIGAVSNQVMSVSLDEILLHEEGEPLS